ncbi:AtpZ/AtpI family protein [Pontibacter sp. G13]|uniref:AtpZ/AtpI family protein n=1 Tax=Pontibacter sp. G13 TaxID=3074898 RepID=UPI0039068F6E
MSDKKNPLRDYIRYAGLGFELLACMLVFIGIGYGLDVWTETEKPWFLLGFALAGSAASIYLLVRNVGRM